jgi:hypothetical protein
MFTPLEVLLGEEVPGWAGKASWRNGSTMAVHAQVDSSGRDFDGRTREGLRQHWQDRAALLDTECFKRLHLVLLLG